MAFALREISNTLWPSPTTGLNTRKRPAHSAKPQTAATQAAPPAPPSDPIAEHECAPPAVPASDAWLSALHQQDAASPIKLVASSTAPAPISGGGARSREASPAAAAAAAKPASPMDVLRARAMAVGCATMLAAHIVRGAPAAAARPKAVRRQPSRQAPERQRAAALAPAANPPACRHSERRAEARASRVRQPAAAAAAAARPASAQPAASSGVFDRLYSSKSPPAKARAPRALATPRRPASAPSAAGSSARRRAAAASPPLPPDSPQQLVEVHAKLCAANERVQTLRADNQRKETVISGLKAKNSVLARQVSVGIGRGGAPSAAKKSQLSGLRAQLSASKVRSADAEKRVAAFQAKQRKQPAGAATAEAARAKRVEAMRRMKGDLKREKAKRVQAEGGLEEAQRRLHEVSRALGAERERAQQLAHVVKDERDRRKRLMAMNARLRHALQQPQPYAAACGFAIGGGSGGGGGGGSVESSSSEDE